MRVPLSPSQRFNVESFLQAQTMIYAIRLVNLAAPRVLPNFTLGYEIFDTCGDVSFALRGAISLLDLPAANMCVTAERFQTTLWEPRAKVVIGAKYSEVSTAVARVLALSSVAQVCLGSGLQIIHGIPSCEEDIFQTIDDCSYKYSVNILSGGECRSSAREVLVASLTRHTPRPAAHDRTSTGTQLQPLNTSCFSLTGPD